MAYSIDPDEMALYEPSLIVLHCLQSFFFCFLFFLFCRAGRVNISFLAHLLESIGPVSILFSSPVGKYRPSGIGVDVG